MQSTTTNSGRARPEFERAQRRRVNGLVHESGPVARPCNPAPTLRKEERGIRSLRATICALASLLLSGLWAATALAQTPFVPDEWKFGKRQESNTLHYCVDGRDPDLPVAREIGKAIASALLL